MAEITKKAMLVRLSIKRWNARKIDKAVTQKVEADYEAINAGRFNKILVTEDAVKEITKAASSARAFHYDNTLPWADDGARILPAKNYLEYTSRMRELKSEFEKSVQVFLQNYDEEVFQARERLKGMFNPEDYPEPERIPKRYGFEVAISPIPEAEDFRVTLQTEEVDAIRNDIDKRTKEAFDVAMKDLWHRLYSAVERMSERLKDADGVFRNSLVQNLCDLCALLPRLNIEGCRELEVMRKRIEEKLCRFEPEILREDKTRRFEVASNAAAILEAMKGYMGNGQDA